MSLMMTTRGRPLKSSTWVGGSGSAANEKQVRTKPCRNRTIRPVHRRTPLPAALSDSFARRCVAESIESSPKADSAKHPGRVSSSALSSRDPEQAEYLPREPLQDIPQSHRWDSAPPGKSAKDQWLPPEEQPASRLECAPAGTACVPPVSPRARHRSRMKTGSAHWENCRYRARARKTGQGEADGRHISGSSRAPLRPVWLRPSTPPPASSGRRGTQSPRGWRPPSVRPRPETK